MPRVGKTLLLTSSSFYKVTRPARIRTLFQSVELWIAAGESNSTWPKMTSGIVNR
jgi:hypothetical protein